MGWEVAGGETAFYVAGAVCVKALCLSGKGMALARNWREKSMAGVRE